MIRYSFTQNAHHAERNFGRTTSFRRRRSNSPGTDKARSDDELDRSAARVGFPDVSQHGTTPSRKGFGRTLSSDLRQNYVRWREGQRSMGTERVSERERERESE